MSVKFEDYYNVLGVDRTATADELQKAFRKLARKYHPDVSKEPDAEEQFKKINEAYEVLKNPETRKQYDALGQNWKAGQDFRAPPGWNPGSAGQGFSGFEDLFGQQSGGYSDFFKIFMGNMGQAPGGGGGGFGFDFGPGPDPAAFRGRQAARPRKGANQEVTLKITLKDIFDGAKKQVRVRKYDAQGNPSDVKTYKVKIPPGTTAGSSIRLAGQGAPGQGGGAPGDLILHIEIDPGQDIDIHEFDLTQVVPVTPWEAALGATVEITGPDQNVLKVKIPAGLKPGNKMRLRGKGLPKDDSESGDLFVLPQIVNPPHLSSEERSLFESLASSSSFNPRDKL